MSNISIKYQLEDIDAAAKQVVLAAAGQKVFLFRGQMGAGKTTLIKSLCKTLGSTDNISSPTFSLVNEYIIPQGKIYHFDFYRLKSQTEALDMGCEEYFYSGNICLIEWPEMIPDLLPLHYAEINLTVTANNSREITIQIF